MTRLSAPTILLAAAFSLAGCPKEAVDPTPKPPAAKPASAPGAGPGAAGQLALEKRIPDADADYIADPKTMPARLGVRRLFLRQPKVTLVRDPLFVPGSEMLVFVAKVGGVIGFWKMPSDGSKPAEIFQPKPLVDSSAPISAKNRSSWFIGTPRIFPDGKNIIFDGSSPNPFDAHPNIIGIASLEGGVISVVEAKGAKAARTPDIHPDGKTVIFAACDELRTGQLEGRGDQVLESTVLLKLGRAENARATVCTVHRPRFSDDGKRVVFEVVGRHLNASLWEKYKMPQPLNEGDGLIEPWIMNADGTGAQRLMGEKGYEPVEGRLQSGGSKEPEVSPAGDLVAFSHGRMIVVTGTDGKSARIVATSNVAGDGNTAVQFAESDPSFSSDGKKLVTASNIIAAQRMAPPGLSIVDLDAADPLQRAEP